MDIVTAFLIIGGIAFYLCTLGLAAQQGALEQDRKRLEETFALVSEVPFEWRRPTVSERLGGMLWSLDGRRGGRAIRFSFRSALVYAVQLRHHPPDLVIGEAALRQRLSGKQAEELAGSLHHLFKVLGFQQLEVKDGWLVVSRLHSSYALSETSLLGVFDALLRIAPALETRKLEVKLGGIRGARGWTAGGEGLLCPYCRDDVADTDLDSTPHLPTPLPDSLQPDAVASAATASPTIIDPPGPPHLEAEDGRTATPEPLPSEASPSSDPARPVVRHDSARQVRPVSVVTAPAARRSARASVHGSDSLIVPADERKNWIWVVAVGIVAAVVYALFFR